MDGNNRPNGTTTPEDAYRIKSREAFEREVEGRDDIRVALDDIRKEIAKTNKALEAIAFHLEVHGGRR